jgi:hypothetical protein
LTHPPLRKERQKSKAKGGGTREDKDWRMYIFKAPDATPRGTPAPIFLQGTLFP